MQFNLFAYSISLRTLISLVGLAVALLTVYPSSSTPSPFSEPILFPGDSTVAIAAGSQTRPQISRGGNGYLAVWQDNRTSFRQGEVCGPITLSGLGSSADIYASRLDNNGHLIDAKPIIVSRSQYCQLSPSVAWNGQYWLVAWSTQTVPNEVGNYTGIIEAIRVSPAGEILDSTPIRLGTSFYQYQTLSITSDGTNWVVTWGGSDYGSGNQILAARVTPNGDVLDPEGRNLVTESAPDAFGPHHVSPDIIFAGNEYLLVWNKLELVQTNSNQIKSVLGQRFSPSLEPLAPIFTINPAEVTGGGPSQMPKVATDGYDFLVGWDGGSKMVSHFGEVGLSPIPRDQAVGLSDICWDGSQYIAAGIYSFSTVKSFLISKTGFLLTTPGEIPATSDFRTSLAIAPKTGGAQLVWTSVPAFPSVDPPHNNFPLTDGDIMSASISTDGSLSLPWPISVSAPRQSQPRVVAGASGFLVVFRSEISNEAKILAQRLDDVGSVIDQEPIVIASGHPGLMNPSVAWNGSSYLIVWQKSDFTYDTQNGPNCPIFGRRLLPDGTLPASEFLISRGITPDVAALGDNFLVVSAQVALNPVTNAIRINGSGVLQGTTAIQGIGRGSFPRVAALGNRWLVAWMNGGAYGQFVNTDGSTSNPFSISTSLDQASFFKLALASSPDSALVVFEERNPADASFELRARRLKADGSFFPGDPTNFVVSSHGMAPSVAWDSNYLLAWMDPRNELYPQQSRGDVFGARVTTDGVLLDSSGFAIAASDFPEDQPSISSRNGISLMVWSAYVDQAPYASMRLRSRVYFTQTPVAPAYLWAGGFGWNQIYLSWQDNANNETGYRVERCIGLDCTDFTELIRLEPNTSSYVDKGLQARTYYRYRVQAFNPAGASAYSNLSGNSTADPPPPTPTPTPTPPPLYSVTGRLTDRDGKGLVSYSVTLTGSQSGFARTDQGGYYRLSSIAGGGNYRVTVQSPGPRVGFTTYYPNPGWVEFNNLAGNQSANFIYNLTSPWVPPGATPTPTPTPAPTPTPTPPPGNDATILNPNFDQGGTNWATTGAVSFTNGIARLTPTNNYSPASILQWVQLTPGATYEVTADITATSSTRLVVGVKYDDSGNITNGPSVPYTNVTRPTTGRVRFTVPNSGNQVGFYAQANGSISNNSLATIDNFRLTRVN